MEKTRGRGEKEDGGNVKARVKKKEKEDKKEAKKLIKRREIEEKVKS